MMFFLDVGQRARILGVGRGLGDRFDHVYRYAIDDFIIKAVVVGFFEILERNVIEGVVGSE